MTDARSLMTFPCDFTIKIIGSNNNTFLKEISDIARKHFPNIVDTAIHNQLSKQGNYLAISITLHVENQKTLDSLYMELTKHPDVKWVL